MANKTKAHSAETLESVRTLAQALYAAFIKRRTTVTTIAKATGLSTNSVKTIFAGETANIASYIAVADAIGFNVVLEKKAAPGGACQPSTFPQQ